MNLVISRLDAVYANLNLLNLGEIGFFSCITSNEKIITQLATDITDQSLKASLTTISKQISSLSTAKNAQEQIKAICENILGIKKQLEAAKKEAMKSESEAKIQNAKTHNSNGISRTSSASSSSSSPSSQSNSSSSCSVFSKDKKEIPLALKLIEDYPWFQKQMQHKDWKGSFNLSEWPSEIITALITLFYSQIPWLSSAQWKELFKLAKYVGAEQLAKTALDKYFSTDDMIFLNSLNSEIDKVLSALEKKTEEQQHGYSEPFSDYLLSRLKEEVKVLPHYKVVASILCGKLSQLETITKRVDIFDLLELAQDTLQEPQ